VILILKPCNWLRIGPEKMALQSLCGVQIRTGNNRSMADILSVIKVEAIMGSLLQFARVALNVRIAHLRYQFDVIDLTNG
jgi:hypothetical protein